MIRCKLIPLLISVALIELISTSAIRAQTTFHWLNTAGGSYHTTSNWTPAGGPPLFDDFARFGLSATYGVTFANAGTQTIDFQVSNGNVTFSHLNTTSQHFWGATSTNYVGPSAGDANSSATLNLTNMFHLPMRGNHLIVGRAAGKTGTLNIFNNGNWESWSGGDFILGQSGTGHLNISTIGTLQKSSLKSNNIALGTSGGFGNANVSGLNASMTATNLLTVGEGSGSQGSLTISNQGSVTVADSLYLGVVSTLDNKVTVTGNGSELVLGNDLTTVGYAGGKGTLNVLSGGKVTNSGSAILIGDSADSIGMLNITGGGSQLLSAGSSSLTIGNAGTGTLNVNAGASLTVPKLNIGQMATGDGTLALHGSGTLVDLFGTSTNFIGNNGTGTITLDAGSVLNSNAMLVFGNSGVGTLTVSGGSQVFSTGGRVGQGAAGSSASINGTGSLWSMTDGLDVGWSNAAHLQIENGGQVNTNGGRLGILASGLGTATLTGANSHWNNAGPATFVVAQSGVGVVNITSGAAMSSQAASLASQSGGHGTVNLDGNGTQWSIGHSLSIGAAGTGVVSISNGATLNAGNNAFVRVGHDGGSSGSLNVAGTGSKILGGVGSSLTLGRSGQGAMDIRQGAVVNVESGRLGQLASGVGSVIVRNTGSQWNMSETLDVGYLGQGALSVQNAGKLTAKHLNVGLEFGAEGTVTLAGLGTTLEVAQNVFVGGSSAADGGVGVLNISSGATASVGNQLMIWSQGEVNMNGGTLKLASLSDQGGQFRWNQGTVQFTQNTILNAGLLGSLIGTAQTLGNGQSLEASAGKTLIVGNTNFAVDGGKINTPHFTNAGTTAVNKGSVTTSGQFLNDVQGTFVVQNLGQTNFAGGAINNGSFLLASAAAKSAGGLFTNNGTLSGRGRLQHQLQNNGTVAVNAGDHLINDNGANMSTNANQIQLSDGRLDVTGALTNLAGSLITGHGVLGTSTANPGNQGLFNQGIIAVSGGALDIHGDVRNLAGGRFNTSGNSTTTFWDDVEHNGLEIRTAQGSSTVFFGSVTGAAPYTGTGSVFFEGDLKPGNSPADVLFEGDLYLGQQALLELEIGGLIAGNDYDQLTVFGDASLNGQLNVALLNDFSPSFGDSFMLIENRSNNPLFGQFVGLAQGANLWSGSQQFSVNYFGGTGNDLVITAVPEPSSTWFLISLVLGITAMQRQKRDRAKATGKPILDWTKPTRGHIYR